MNKLGHSIGGVVTMGLSAALSYKYLHLNWYDYGEGLPAIYVGAFIPDMDAEHSYIRSKIPVLPKVYTGIQKLFSNTPLNCVFKHRGLLFHSFYTFLPIGFAGYYTHLYSLFGGLILGILSHHLLDMTTPAGLNYFGFRKTS